MNKSNFAIGWLTNQQTISPASSAQKRVLSWSILVYPESLVVIIDWVRVSLHKSWTSDPWFAYQSELSYTFNTSNMKNVNTQRLNKLHSQIRDFIKLKTRIVWLLLVLTWFDQAAMHIALDWSGNVGQIYVKVHVIAAVRAIPKLSKDDPDEIT